MSSLGFGLELLVTEEEQQIDAAALHSLEQLLLLRALHEVGLQRSHLASSYSNTTLVWL
jgi:hypothetical protein